MAGLDVLVNNLGVARIATWYELADAEWQAAWDTNVMSYVRAIRAALPHLRESDHAAIVNVASTSGKRPSVSMPHYSVTKAAVLSLSRLVADAHAKDGIRCNAVCPGPTRTPAWLGEGGLADQTAALSGRDRDEVLDGRREGPADRPHGRARRDRRRDRVPGVAGGVLRDRFCVERRRRHGPRDHLRLPRDRPRGRGPERRG